MAKFRGRKKRVALAMGLASLLGASKMTSAAGNKAGGANKMTSAAGNKTGGAGKVTSAAGNKTGKVIGLTAGGLGLAGLLYEVLADTVGRDKKMPSALKAFGVIKNKEDGQIPISPELRKKINNELKKQKIEVKSKVDDTLKHQERKVENKDVENKDVDALKKQKAVVENKSNAQMFGSFEIINKPEDADDKELCFGALEIMLRNYNYGMNTIIGNENIKSVANMHLRGLANSLGLVRGNYDPQNGRNQFLIDVAHKIGLQGVTDENMLCICSHNYSDVNKKLNSDSNWSDEQKKMLLLLCRLRNMIAYECGAGAAGAIKMFFKGGDGSEGRPGGLPKGFFEEEEVADW